MQLRALIRNLTMLVAAGSVSLTHATAPDQTTLDKIAALSVPFVPNAGQWDARAAFAAKTFAGTLFVTRSGELVYSLPGKVIDTAQPKTADSHLRGRHPAARTAGWALTETVVDAQGMPRSMSQSTLKAPAGILPMEGKVSFGIGNDPAKHADNLNSYERVNLGDMYPGVNVQLRATGSNVEKIFTVAAHHDPQQIHIRIKGAEKLEIGTQGELIAHTGNGPVAFTAPIAFQEAATGERRAVAVAYQLDAERERYGFSVGPYDRALPLTIDPLLQSTYLGGTGGDYTTAMAIHPASGEVYVAGYTDSTDLPGVFAGAQAAKSSGVDAYVSRFNALLTTRLQSSYFGGNGADYVYAVAIHPASGEVYVAGGTDSSDMPGIGVGVGGSAQAVKSSSQDAFVSRFNAALTTLLRSSYLGGNGDDYARALAIHPASGEVYVAGTSDSTNLPGAAGGAQALKSIGVTTDAFVSRFNAALTVLLQSSYLGGSGYESAYALAIHPASAEVYIAGVSSSLDLPGVAGGAQAAKSSGGMNDAFVSRFNATLTTLLQSSYLGGGGTDIAHALAIHPASGDVYVAGLTDSIALPGVSGGAQQLKSGFSDAFVSRFNAALTILRQSSYLGGGGTDSAYALAIHPASGEVYVAGGTNSTDLPGVAGGAQAVKSTSDDAFVGRFNAALTTLLRSTYLGGTGVDLARALALHPASGDVYVAGSTDSTDLPGVANGAQALKATGVSTDAFVSRFTPDLSFFDQTPNPFAFATQGNVPLATVRTSNPALISGIVGATPVYIEGALGSSYCISSGNNCSCDGSGGFVSTVTTISNNSYVCVRHVSASIVGLAVDSKLHVGGAAASFISTTGTAFNTCSLDIDGNGSINPLSDGLILVRAMLGLTGTAVTDGAISGSPPRNTWALIQPYLNGNCGTNFLQ